MTDTGMVKAWVELSSQYARLFRFAVQVAYTMITGVQNGICMWWKSFALFLELVETSQEDLLWSTLLNKKNKKKYID